MTLDNKLSVSGKWGFAVALLFVFSISATYRVNIGGLLVHPYLLFVPLAVLFGKLNFQFLPKDLLTALVVFFVIFSLASLQNVNPLSEIFKVGASLFTFIFFVLVVRTERDVRTIAWAFVLCALAIGVQGFLLGEATAAGARLSGINALEGLGNKNAQSLYTLPGVFFGVLLFLKYNKAAKITDVAFVSVALFFILISIFLSANRSGWLGLFIILVSFVIYLGVGLRSVLLVAIFAYASYYIVNTFASDIVDHKRKQTEEGYSSDVGRQRLAMRALEVGLENPIMGVGMDNLHREMAYSLGLDKYGVKLTDTHILWGYLFGATGAFSLLSFLYFLISIAKRRHVDRGQRTKDLTRLRWLLMGFIVLFCARSLFSREILYSPTFMGGMGLIFGYYLFHVRHARSAAR